MSAESRAAARQLVQTLTGPESVVVVGASADPAKSSSRPLRYLSEYGFAGRVIAVNPNRAEVLGFPAVPGVADLDVGSAEVAIVNLPAPAVPAVVADLDHKGVRAAVVIGSGFERPDSAPRAELLEVLDRPGRRIRVIGPNCVGTMSVASGAHLNFSSVLRSGAPRQGSVALVTQSGATGNGILMSLIARGVGVSHWFSTGNELDVGALEIVAGLLQRDDVESVGLFLEAITDIDWLPMVSEILAETGKRVFVMKIADSELGQIAAGGHTGRVVGSADISHAVLGQVGFIRVDSIAELCDCLVVTDIAGAMPPSTRVAVASVSGASAVIVSDGVHDSPRLELADLSNQTIESIDEIAGGRIGHVGNPLDIPFLDETSTFAAILNRLSTSGDGDVVLGVESSLAHDREELARALVARDPESAPILLTRLSEDDTVTGEIVHRLAAARVALIPTPERAVRALHLTAGAPAGDSPASSAASDEAAGRSEDESVLEPPRRQLGIDEIAALLPARFPWADWAEVSSPEGAQAAGMKFGYPLAVKAIGRTIGHRSELGAVEIVTTEDDLRASYERVAAICADHGDGVMVQAGASGGHEVMVAVVRDAEYGVAALARPGGVLVELLDEQAVLWSRWSPARRREILRRSRLGTILAGYRGGAAGDVDALAGAMDLAIAAVVDDPKIDLIEFNPMIVTSDGVSAVDALGYTGATGS